MTEEPNAWLEQSDGAEAVASVLAAFDLERVADDRFIGHPGSGRVRLFGGLVAAQSTLAAARTVADGDIHSLHAYFLRPGDYETPIEFEVDRIRDGRTFTTRRVVAYQRGEAIFTLSASFARPEPGPEYQAPMPEVPAPEELELLDALRERVVGKRPDHVHVRAIEVRCRASEGERPKPGEGERFVWMRARAPLPDDPLLHAAFTVYASDRTLLGAPVRKLGLVQFDDLITTSLDHSMWFHHPPRFDGWMLYTSTSPAARAARGLALGAMYRADGTQIFSVAQEGLLRRPRAAPGRT